METIGLAVAGFILLGIEAMIPGFGVFGVAGILAWYLPRDSKYNPFVLWDRQKSSGSNTLSREVKEYTGRTGKALTPLRPAGIAEIDGKRIDVQTQGEFIEPGTVVVVLRTEGSKVLVEAAADKAK